MWFKYVWLVVFIANVYVLYSTDYYAKVEEFVKSYHESLKALYEGSTEYTNDKGEIIFTPSALRKYSNLDNGLYLAILGQVFDVTDKIQHYGPGSTYHVFTGRDASAAFITGDFTNSGLTDDISSLTNKQIQSLVTWTEFYRKNYKYKGKLIGRFYDKYGMPTSETLELQTKLEVAKTNDSDEEMKRIKFPPCNIEWQVATGTTVWCTKNSGGVTRDWIGVPRMLYDGPDLKTFRCACINLESKDYEENKGAIRTYENCDDQSSQCNIITN